MKKEIIKEKIENLKGKKIIVFFISLKYETSFYTIGTLLGVNTNENRIILGEDSISNYPENPTGSRQLLINRIMDISYFNEEAMRTA